ncbi:hypothetical protein JZ751_029849 [Albula glossodonta]|uniref:Uncharacterized protein n=1 Tax=Albula glossodonta TaxID=121402 RepID=A0A8T2NE02_9TELE|nr:hypothetical protein JZ751_029849 [Albula glossodonta]
MLSNSQQRGDERSRTDTHSSCSISFSRSISLYFPSAAQRDNVCLVGSSPPCGHLEYCIQARQKKKKEKKNLKKKRTGLDLPLFVRSSAPTIDRLTFHCKQATSLRYREATQPVTERFIDRRNAINSVVFRVKCLAAFGFV